MKVVHIFLIDLHEWCGTSYYWQSDCLFNKLFRLASLKTLVKNMWRLYYIGVLAEKNKQSDIDKVYLLIFVDLRFEHHFIQIYTWDVTNGRYSKDWRLNMETVEGPVLLTRSKIECSIKCRGIANCTGVDYINSKLLCHTYGTHHINLP